MDRIDAMRLFTRIVERRSFTAAANDIGIPRATATRAVMDLEARLGTRLLQRTTRQVRPTLDGEAYYRRCLAILGDIEDAEGAFGGAKPRGLVRADVQGTLARHFILDALPEFLAEYPDIQITMSETERSIDIIGEGADCVLRYGALPDSEMIARRVAMLDRVTVATPAYLEKYGMPEHPLRLGGHRMVGLRSLNSGAIWPLDFIMNGRIERIEIPATVSVTGTESYRATTLLGLGIAQMPRFHIAGDLARGDLVALLTDWPCETMPVSLLYPRTHQLSPRVRVFMDWVAREFARKCPGN